LLAGAVELARQAGAKELEAYPVKPYGADVRVPAAFAWTGVPRLFERHKFKNVTPSGSGRDILKRSFRQRP